MKYRYARVSNVGQNIDSQIKELKSYAVDEIVTEKISGASAKKVKQKELLEKLKEGDFGCSDSTGSTRKKCNSITKTS